MIVVEVYSKSDCSLCDRAKEKLREIRRKYPFELREITLTEEDEQYAEFSSRVPVIILDRETRFDYRVPETEFIEALRALERRKK